MGKVTFLLADDEIHIRMLLKKVITSMNGEVIGEAKDGQEAFDLYKMLHPHVTLLDINMPGKTGDEALREILEYDPKAIIIMLTSVADAESVKKCILLGAANYIRKDNPLQKIKEMIAETFRMLNP